MSLITDGILIAASLTACFYCLVLNVRLKALRNTETGIGATITKLTDSVVELEASLSETKAAHSHSVEKLEDLVGEAGTLADFLSDLLEQAEAAEINPPASAKATPNETPSKTPEETPAETAPEAKTAPEETISEDKEKELPTDIPLDLDSGDINLDETAEDQPADTDEKSDKDNTEDDFSIELDFEADEPMKAGVG